MPTYEEIYELIDNCTWEWTTRNGVKGYVVTGANDNSIFLPAAGFRFMMALNDAGNGGAYWSSSLFRSNPIPDCSYYLCFNSGRDYVAGVARIEGLSVRPVYAE